MCCQPRAVMMCCQPLCCDIVAFDVVLVCVVIDDEDVLVLY
jgi:hypothetical protein